MTDPSVAKNFSERKWRRSGFSAWVLTLLAGLFAALMSALAVCMAYPVRWDGPGQFGALALYFPLHLLVFTIAAAVLAFVANRSGARLRAMLFGFVVVLTAVMALAPAVATWQYARRWDVALSLGDYLANASHINSGSAQTERSVAYGTAKDGTKLELDVWRSGEPDTGPLRPAVVIVHGGTWIYGTRSMLPDWDRWLTELGYEVFDVEYRIPPPVRWLDEIGDVKSALGWIAAHAAEFHVDPRRISAMGYSAGGNLVMLAAYSMNDPQLPPSTDVPAVAVRSVINLYGPSDMPLLYRSSPSVDYVQAALKQYIGGAPQEFPERYRALSPLSHVGANTPPTLTLLGTSDRFLTIDQATKLDQALTANESVHQLYLLPANDHAFDVNWGGFGTQFAREEIKAFLQKYG